MWPLVFDNLQIYEMASTEERGVLEGKEGRRGDTERRGRVEVSDQKEYILVQNKYLICSKKLYPSA
jgi:hypothetical protein